MESAEAVLNNRTLKWSTPRNFNDPFDVQAPLLFNVADEQIVEQALGLISLRFHQNRPIKNELGVALEFIKSSGVVLSPQQVRQQFASMLLDSVSRLRRSLPSFCDELLVDLANSKILCLSARVDQPPMWAHYSDNHRGIAIEFSADAGVDTALMLARPVNYVPVMPNFVEESEYAGIIAGEAEWPSASNILDKFIYSKLDAWSYEEEWRVYDPTGRCPESEFEFGVFYPSDLKSLTFGLRSSDIMKNTLRDVAISINPQVRFYDMERVGGQLIQRDITRSNHLR
jgi:Protein of unknown function (DUF2971)